MKKNSYITVTDQFCGAGGSSQGVRNYSQDIGGGVEVKLALNHWKLAIETHNTNFPDTIHDCTDISASDPRRYPSTDLLITSQECSNHSLAKGKKIVKAQLDLFDKGKLDPAAERSRATMWDVPRFAEYHGYNVIIVENVVDARKWVMWDAWLQAMHLLGYNHKCCYVNSMHFHPTPQSRDRMYIVFWKKGNKAPNLDYQPMAHCIECGHDVQSVQSWKKGKFGKFKTQYTYRCPVHHRDVTPYYYAAFNAIDWTDIGKKIGERKIPLKFNTTRRIQYGLDKYGNQPFQVINYSPGYAQPVSNPFGTITTTDHHGIVMPFIIKLEHSKNNPSGKVFPITSALPTQTTCEGIGFCLPQIIELSRTGKSRPADQPLSTMLTSGSHHGILTTESWNSFIACYYGGSNVTSHFTEAFRTQSTNDRYQLITYQQPNIEDCYYRMIKPPEVKCAMAFDSDYIILGTGKEQVKQCGNAVTPPVMRWLVQQCVESLAS